MREAKPSPRVRHGDLAVVHVTREHELEALRLELIEHPRVVAEQDPEVRLARERVRVRLLSPADDQAWMDSGDPDGAAAQLEELPLVAKEPYGTELAQVRGAGLRV